MLNIFLNSYMTSKMSIRMRTAVDAVVSVIENNMGASAASMTAVVDYYGTANTSYIIVFDEKGSVKVATSNSVAASAAARTAQMGNSQIFYLGNGNCYNICIYNGIYYFVAGNETDTEDK